MGKEKAGYLTPKAIGNRIKAKGLQKLRWYCQMCQKQCRDENGFKCHTMSESHQRQLLLVADNPNKFVDTFSNDFNSSFLNLLSRKCGTKRVHCNVVYQDYIADRNHIHMNSTRWYTLTEYIKWLGRKGLCTVDETEKGWFIQYIDRSPEAIMRQQNKEESEKSERIEADLEEKRLRKMIEKGAKEYEEKKKLEEEDPKAGDFVRTNEDEKIVFKMPEVPKVKKEPITLKENVLAKAAAIKKEADMERWETSSTSSRASSTSSVGGKRKSALEEIKEMEERKKARTERKDNWIIEGIIVKIVNMKLGEEFNNKKAVVAEVKDKYEAVLRLVDGSSKIKLHQSYLRTVLPAIGKQVQVVNGAYRGTKATLKSIEEEKYSCTIMLDSGPFRGKTLSNIDYEDICKLY